MTIVESSETLLESQFFSYALPGYPSCRFVSGGRAFCCSDKRAASRRGPGPTSGPAAFHVCFTDCLPSVRRPREMGQMV